MKLPQGLVYAATLILLALVLLSVGQPIYTDDLWWHLALGDAYRADGPWLSEDPALYTATAPPLPASWLADAGLSLVAEATGAIGLRAVHVLAAFAILGLGGSLLWRASGSPVFASLATSLFAILAAYRLFQLRPHLGTILAALILYRLLLEEGASRSRWKLVAGGFLLAFWANVHAGFVLGLTMTGAALGAVLVALPLRAAGARAVDLQRARYLALALTVGVLASLLNPAGVLPHLAYFMAGIESPELTRVGDEWARFTLLQWPRVNLPPSPLAWAILWGLWVTTLLGAGWSALRWNRPSGKRSAMEVDPALMALAGLSLVASLFAVRFVWMGIFPLLLIGQVMRSGEWTSPISERSRSRFWVAAIIAILLIPGFLRFGPWPMISRGIPARWQMYSYPYPADKHFGHAIWFMKDAGLEGNLFNNYSVGSFASFWLPPKLKLFVNGSLNVSRESMDAGRALRQRQGVAPGETFVDALDRQDVDVFLGVRLPHYPFKNRHSDYTTGHLEKTPGWILVFRNIRSAVYLRDNDRNRDNLERVARYYRSQRIPFDAERGFDPERIIRENPRWALGQGLVPVYFERISRAAYGSQPTPRRRARNQLAAIYAALGLYELAIEVDRNLLLADPTLERPRRRLVWSLIRSDRAAEALAAAQGFKGRSGADPYSVLVAAAAERYATETDPEVRAEMRSTLPLFPVGDGQWLETSTARAQPRPLQKPGPPETN